MAFHCMIKRSKNNPDEIYTRRVVTEDKSPVGPWLLALFVFVVCGSGRDDHSGDPYHGGYDMPYGGGGPPSYGPPQPWGHPDMHLMQPHHGIPIQARLGNLHDLDMGPPPPVMKTFKEFLLSLDDSVDETEAVKRYNEYKIDFRRQQMQDFFLAHKDEECLDLNLFFLLPTPLPPAAVIKMEGGTEHDLRILEQTTEEEENKHEKGAPGGGEPPKKEEPRGGDSDRKLTDKEDKKEDKGESGGESVDEKIKKPSEDEGEKSAAKEEPESKKMAAQNPLLKNITDYLIEEVSAEEEELLGSSGDQPEDGAKEGNPTEVTIERDDKLVKVLDRLLLYLRIVHSIDYYNSCEYQCEDEMPNRCGLLHVRGPVPPNRITHGEVVDWQKTFEEKLNPLFSVKESISEEEAKKMGKKDPGQEVEKFVSANTQELGKDKWLCPLSGKKFKGPEFVRKHVFNKHGDKIEEVRKEVIFFNNFLMDAKRPSLPEIKPPPPPAPGGPPYPPNQYGGGRGNYDSFRGQGGYPGKPRNRSVARRRGSN
ncbi:UNVERIFIED_CONTAM: hypothetical protein FKN15_020529 [Acipenser sinensis]